MADVLSTDQAASLTQRHLWDRVILLAKLRTAQKVLLLAVSNRAAADLVSRKHPAATFARDTGLGESTVRALLERLGWLVVSWPNRREPKHLTLCWPFERPTGIRTESASSQRSETADSERTEDARPPAPSTETASSQHESAPSPPAPGPIEGNDEEGREKGSGLEETFRRKLTEQGRLRNGHEVDAVVRELLGKFSEDDLRSRLERVPDDTYRYPSEVKSSVRSKRKDRLTEAREFGRNRAGLVVNSDYHPDDARGDCRQQLHDPDACAAAIAEIDAALAVEVAA